jgi:hypothetical protein
MNEPIQRAVLENLFGSLSNSHYTAIGRVASSAAAFESVIASYIWKLGKIDDELGACITSQISCFDGKIKALIAILR